jgi:transcriptional regulator with XRE-family HTH domain
VPAPIPTKAQLGHAIRALREAKGLSIEALAAEADMHPTYLSGIERGRNNPSWTKLCGLATALDIPVSAIATGAEKQASTRERKSTATR